MGMGNEMNRNAEQTRCALYRITNCNWTCEPFYEIYFASDYNDVNQYVFIITHTHILMCDLLAEIKHTSLTHGLSACCVCR